jgi:hypothetical protein
MKRLLIVLATVFASVAVAAPAVSAKPEPVGGCGAGFELMDLKTVLRELAAEGFEDALRAADTNADEFLCVRVLENFPKPFEPGKPVFVFTDNNAAP